MSELSDEARTALNALRETGPTDAQRARLRARLLAATAMSGVAASASVAVAAQGAEGSAAAGAASISASSAPGALGTVAAGAQVSGAAVGQAVGTGAAVASKAAVGVGAKLAGLSLGTKLAGAALAVASATATVPLVHDLTASRTDASRYEERHAIATAAAEDHGSHRAEARAGVRSEGAPGEAQVDPASSADDARVSLQLASPSSADLSQSAALRSEEPAQRARVEPSPALERERGGDLATLERAARGAQAQRMAVRGSRVRASEERTRSPLAPGGAVDLEISGEPTTLDAPSSSGGSLATREASPQRAESTQLPPATRGSLPTPEASPQLRAESTLLLRALSALETGELCRARSFLDEHARSFAQGALLVHERERLNQRLQSQLGADPGRAHCGQKGPLP